MNEMTIEELKAEIRKGARCILQVRHAERPKMDPDDPTFGDALALTDEGVRTAREFGKILAEFRDDVQFYASPLRRTVMTAELIAEGMGVEEKSKSRVEGEGLIPTDDRLGNASFYYDDPAEVLEMFQPGKFFSTCFEYFEKGEQRGFKNLFAATDALEQWLFERFTKKLFIVTTHDCYIAAFLAARRAVEKFTIDNWTRFLDGGAILIYPDGSRKYALVRAGLSRGICGVHVLKGDTVTRKAHAKINWTLQVLGVRPDGYHELKSIVLPVELHDDITVAPLASRSGYGKDSALASSDRTASDLASPCGVTVEGCGDVPLEKNLVYIAAMKLAKRMKLENPSAAITVVKRIPAGAGLGGGSADAAATLRALDAFWHLNLPEEILLEVAAEVGSDVPALLIGEPVMMEGRGERVRRLTAAEREGLPKREKIVLYTPPIFSSTVAVYKEHRESDNGQGRNDLQPAALRLYPGIADALEKLRAEGLANVAMSGSGSTVYGIRK